MVAWWLRRIELFNIIQGGKRTGLTAMNGRERDWVDRMSYDTFLKKKTLLFAKGLWNNKTGLNDWLFNV